MSTTELNGKVAIVTGGSRGIGLAITRGLVAGGARVVVSGRDGAALEQVRASLGDAVTTVSGDVAEAGVAEALVSAATGSFGGLDILVNNAGIGRFAPVADMAPEDWHRQIATNLTAVFLCTRAAIPALRQRKGGWIVNISSLAGKNAFVGGAAYCATKAGLNAFSEALMQEVRDEDIRVAYVMPGSVQTGFSPGGDGAEMSWKLSPDDVAQVVLDLLAHPARSLPSRVEIRPAKPRKR
jgi:3-oxoacyl-[acyl-carrier protein] reductase